MAFVKASKNAFSIKAYIGDNKTLLAFNFANQADTKNLAGFTIACKPPGLSQYYLWNELQFPDPSKHAQVASEKPNSTAIAPIQKFRWVHVPGVNHQGIIPVTGSYQYTVTPRFFNAQQSMLPLDASLSASVVVPVGPFKKQSVSLGFTKGYMQSEAFAHRFGNSSLQPANKPLQFDTSGQAGTVNGQSVTFADIYAWMGATARQQIFTLLDKVVNDSSLTLQMLAYDLNEPDILTMLLKLAAEGRVSIILDNSSEHHSPNNSLPEDQFATLFGQKAKVPASIVRGCFDRFAHDKILIVLKNGSATEVLTGSTNFSINGLYVNANHILFFDDAVVASHYSKVFTESLQILKQTQTPSKSASNAFSTLSIATTPFSDQPPTVPKLSITFAPHTAADTTTILNAITARIQKEATAENGNVIFAVMQLTQSQTPVYQILNTIHATQSLFSYGISDSPAGVVLYSAKSKKGVLVTGKPRNVILPPPFDQVPAPPGHEIHDKFVVCGLNGSDPVVYCGSSNLATGGEQANGDNLLEIHDPDVATAFAIEALLLIDHYAFLDRCASPGKSSGKKSAAPKNPPAQASAAAGKSGAKKSAAKKRSAPGTGAKARKRVSRS